MTSMTALLLELERITPISVTTSVMHATMIDSIKELPPEIDFSSSGGIALWRHKVAEGMRKARRCRIGLWGSLRYGVMAIPRRSCRPHPRRLPPRA